MYFLYELVQGTSYMYYLNVLVVCISGMYYIEIVLFTTIITIFCLPYIKGLSETLQRTCQPLNMRIANKATDTLRSILPKVKTHLDSYQKTDIIYQIPCSCGEVFIGETGKTINEKVKEHKRSVCRMDTNNSIAVYVMNTSHDIAWDQATIITQETHRLKRKIKEAMLIQKTPYINMDSGLHLDPI